ncbi:hypothetical protein M378DRAFT_19551 [Amanita muscaria Koide BX008]|uniref:Uncharacterized protein n=1 Tax=Amanita muscaria (strain Koide BX008) TaxID=946122 RepID=A0A0C2VY69_AMAMK|nr:hypothetical protein M378DRAFT_19551 [Amanita muscaria Koide BX008]
MASKVQGPISNNKDASTYRSEIREEIMEEWKRSHVPSASWLKMRHKGRLVNIHTKRFAHKFIYPLDSIKQSSRFSRALRLVAALVNSTLFIQGIISSPYANSILFIVFATETRTLS